MILSEAARLFAKHGFDATSMREIAAAVNLTVGSLYWYFDSKEKLFSAVNEAGINAMYDAVVRATDGIHDPWDRLTAAAEAHCDSLLNPKDVMAVFIPSTLGPIRRKLVAQRDRYEDLFRELVEALELPDHVDKTLFRLQLLAGLSGVLSWYKPAGRFTAREIARRYVQMLRRGAPAKLGKELKASLAAA